MRGQRQIRLPNVCVVGSGFAGLALAERLAERGASVLVLDAGRAGAPATPPPVAITGDADFDVDDSRVVAPGGTSARWNGVATRPEPVVIAGWPLSSTELAPYLDQAEVWLQVAGDPAVAGAEPPRPSLPRPSSSWSAGSTLRPEHLPSLAHLSPVVLPFAFVDGGPRRLHEHDLPRIAAHPGVEVRAGAWVRAVEPGAWGRGVTLHVASSPATDAPTEEVRAGVVVLACGVVETVRVLQSSRGRWRRRIGGDLLGAGINAHPRRRCTVARAPALDGLRGVLRSYRIGDQFADRGLGRVVLDVNYMEATPMIDVTVEQEAVGANRIRSTRSGLSATLWLSERDRATLAAADALIAEVCTALPAAGAPSPITTRWFHPAGGCVMGHDATTGVVDPHGQVFGAPGVYVAGAATFPTSGAGNPTLTITALALRLADHLADHRAGQRADHGAGRLGGTR